MKVVTIKFPPEHENRLRRLGIKTPFVLNIAKYGSRSPEEYAQLVATQPQDFVDWGVFIGAAFRWSETPEGKNYWEVIANYKTRK